MQTIYLTGKEPMVRDIARATYPTYAGNKFKLAISDGTVNCASCWGGGSRDYFVFLNLATMERTGTMPAQSAFDRKVDGLDAVPMQPGFAIVEHSIFCGKDMGLTIHIHPDNATPLLPAPNELSADESTCLKYTCGRKSSYAGIPDYRFHEAHQRTGITRNAWLAAKASLIAKGLLNKAGAITPAGRNAVETLPGRYSL
jgi:hypothetical protein